MYDHNSKSLNCNGLCYCIKGECPRKATRHVFLDNGMWDGGAACNKHYKEVAEEEAERSKVHN